MALVPFAKRAREIVGDSGLFGDISILERLEDFRKRIVRALLAVAAGALVGFAFIDHLVGFLLQPTRRALPIGTKLIYTEPGEAFGLYVQVALIAGVVFAMPTVVFFLAKVGLITAGILWRSFRYAFLLIFIAAAVITPTGDMVTQTIFAAPMVALYLLSIGIAWMFGKVTPIQPTDLDE